MSFNKVQSSSGPRFPFVQNIIRRGRGAAAWVALVTGFVVVSLVLGSVLVGESIVAVLSGFWTFAVVTGSIVFSVVQSYSLVLVGGALLFYACYVVAYRDSYQVSETSDSAYTRVAAQGAATLVALGVVTVQFGGFGLVSGVVVLAGCFWFSLSVVEATTRDSTEYLGSMIPQWVLLLGTRFPFLVVPVFVVFGIPAPLTSLTAVAVVAVAPTIAVLYGGVRFAQVRGSSGGPDVGLANEDSEFKFE